MARAVFGQADAEALSFQRVFDNHGQGLFVLDQQYVYRIHKTDNFVMVNDKWLMVNT